ncbi:hypothetical protein [Candidatus Lokiarchaeum ossiferum]|uniref:hypothetical protein n=1 Tax=Candidatus Lokiarchaeum ossiferum TaxID=2951803 RepID=UPI00352D2295
MKNLSNQLILFLKSKPKKIFVILIFLSFFVYSGIIIFGFVPTTKIIETSFYSTSDLQAAKTRVDVDKILTAWEPVMSAVIRLSFLDYLFIVSGFILFISINCLILISVHEIPKIRYVPLIGFLATIISRLLDSLEDLWAILIYSNPGTYPTFLIPLLNITEDVKWVVVAIEYSLVGIGLICIIYEKIKTKRMIATDKDC